MTIGVQQRIVSVDQRPDRNAIEIGTNILVGNDAAKLRRELSKILAGNAKQGAIPLLWDGRASERIADIIVEGAGSSAEVQHP